MLSHGLHVGTELLPGSVHPHAFILRLADIADRVLAERRERRLEIEVFAPAENTPLGIHSFRLRSPSQNKSAIITGQLLARVLKLETIPGAADGAVYKYFSRNLSFARFHIRHRQLLPQAEQDKVGVKRRRQASA